MSKNVAVFNDSSKVINIINVNDDYELNTNEMFYTDDNPAYIGGDYFDGYFYAKQPFASWTRSEGRWISPIPYPTTEGRFYWDEELGDWVEALAE
jgi:hypothetical protein